MTDPVRLHKPSECEAHTVGQDEVCNRCEVVWSMDDTPPTCLDRLAANLLKLKRMRLNIQSGVKL